MPQPSEFILDRDDPHYTIQQRFRQVALDSRSEDPDEIHSLACADWRGGRRSRLPRGFDEMFRAWAAVTAENNKALNNDPWMQASRAWAEAGCQGPAPRTEDYDTIF